MGRAQATPHSTQESLGAQPAPIPLRLEGRTGIPPTKSAGRAPHPPRAPHGPSRAQDRAQHPLRGWGDQPLRVSADAGNNNQKRQGGALGCLPSCVGAPENGPLNPGRKLMAPTPPGHPTVPKGKICTCRGTPKKEG